MAEEGTVVASAVVTLSRVAWCAVIFNLGGKKGYDYRVEERSRQQRGR